MSKPKGDAELEELFAHKGMIFCPLCSQDGWKIYHKPENCPKEVSDGVQEEEEKEIGPT